MNFDIVYGWVGLREGGDFVFNVRLRALESLLAYLIFKVGRAKKFRNRSDTEKLFS